uniref:Aurora kinase A and ninein-interacting protein-like n=1 Tax=Geotrypetes seraphini TaxID=260995 RepID=A0A6P8S1U8_GEOSA|nr:aurora kinase A and ninein-interacting protein-like [Geotrypetes seraphini]
MSREAPEACGVWLDTSRLKKRQTLLIGPTSKLLSPFLRRTVSAHTAYEFTQTKAIRPCIKQTTISSFFIPKPAGKENTKAGPAAQSLPARTWKSSKRKGNENYKEPCHKKSSTEFFQGIAERDKLCFRSETPKTKEWDYNPVSQLQEDQQSDFNLAPKLKKTQIQDHTLVPVPHQLTDQNMFLKSSYEVWSNAAASMPCGRQEHSNLGENEDYGSQLDFTQDSEGNHVLAHKSKHDSVSLGEGISNRKITTVEKSSSALGNQQSNLNTKHYNRHGESSVSDLQILNQLQCETSLKDQWDWENNDPTEMERDFYPTGKERSTLECQQGVSRFPWERESPGIEFMSHEEEQIVSASQLFTQDSQGHKVISHHYLHGIPRKKVLALHDRTNQFQSSNIKALPLRDSCRMFSCSTTEAFINPQALELQSHPSFLFTQDSEGNTVIKHG